MLYGVGKTPLPPLRNGGGCGDVPSSHQQQQMQDMHAQFAMQQQLAQQQQMQLQQSRMQMQQQPRQQPQPTQQRQRNGGTGNGWTQQQYQLAQRQQYQQQQQQQAYLHYTQQQQYPIPYSDRPTDQYSQGQSRGPPSYPISSSHHQQQYQQVHLHQQGRGWMEPAGTSNGFNGNIATNGVNGTGAPNGYNMQFAVSTSSGFNGQLVNGMSSNGMLPVTSSPTSNGNTSATIGGSPSQSMQSAQSQKAAQKLEEYYNAERARESARSMAAAATQLFGGGCAGPGGANNSQKPQKLEGLPAGMIPAGGIRKPKQQRAPRADVAPPASVATATSTSANGSPDGAGAGALVPVANGSALAVVPVVPSGPVRRPDANATGGEIVAYLMTFNIQHGEADFSSKALESLHKKIKDRPQDMEAFMRCVETKGEVVGGCITVTRTLDGRLQVAGRKGFPHVIYTKIFRFQELHKNELKSIPMCLFGFENKAENEEHKPDAQVCVNPYHYERVSAPAGSGSHIDPLTGLLRVNGMHHSMDDMMDFASSSHMKLSASDFLNARPSMLEDLRLSNPPPLGGFGYSSLDLNKSSTEPPRTFIKTSMSMENLASNSSSLSPQEMVTAAVDSMTVSNEANEAHSGMNGTLTVKTEERDDTEMTDASSASTEIINTDILNNFFNLHYDSSSISENEETREERILLQQRLLAASHAQIQEASLHLETEQQGMKLEELRKYHEAYKIPQEEDADYTEACIARDNRLAEIQIAEQELYSKKEQLARMQAARDPQLEDFMAEPDIWNAQYTDADGKPSFHRTTRWMGEPPNPNVVVGETGNGTYGSKGPHLKPRAHIKKLEWSLQQVIRMLEIVSRNKSVSGAQYLLCCQHYAGMIKKTQGASSLDPLQQKLADKALERVKEMGGGKVTYQQLHYWDISRLFANHLKTIPERRQEEEERKQKYKHQFNSAWKIEIDEELNHILMDIRGTDAEGIFSRKQITTAMKARQKIIDGEKIVPDGLMDCEEMKSEGAMQYDAQKRQRRMNRGEDPDAMELNPILPVLENVFTADDLYTLFESPHEYLKSFRDTLFGEDEVPIDWDEEADLSLRSVVPPKDGDMTFQPFDGKERENDEPDENGEERPPFKRNCLCPEKEKREHCFWGKHHHYMQGVSREIVDAAFILYRYRIQRKKSKGPKGELYHFANQFNCPAVCMNRTTEIEPHSAKSKPANYNWCAINYCERDNHVGELRQVEDVNYFIDGGMDSNNDQRYCINTLDHPHTRFDRDVNDIKNRIGSGVRISVKEDGSMWVRVLSRYPIFISSTFLDREAGLVSGDAIHKIYPGSSIKAFDLERSRRAILQMYDYQCEAHKLHNGDKTRVDLPYPLSTFNRREIRAISRIGGDDMQKHAVVKIGFMKGWGPEFEFKRICETPCWVEVINNRACEFIDHIMNLREVSYAFSELDSSDYDD